MKQLLLSVIIAGLFTACSKEKSIETNGTPGGNNQTGDNWQPMSKNSYWKYKTTGDMEYETTTTSSGQKRTVNGIEYTVFKTVTTGTPEAEALFAIKDHNYYSRAAGTSPMGNSFDINYLYLNDTASAGYTVDHTAGQGNGFTALTTVTIIERGITMTVEGESYSDVIHSQLDLQYELPLLGAIHYVTYDYYAAKNVGIIRIETHGDPILTNGLEAVTDLVEYSIK